MRLENCLKSSDGGRLACEHPDNYRKLTKINLFKAATQFLTRTRSLYRLIRLVTRLVSSKNTMENKRQFSDVAPHNYSCNKILFNIKQRLTCFQVGPHGVAEFFNSIILHDSYVEIRYDECTEWTSLYRLLMLSQQGTGCSLDSTSSVVWLLQRQQCG